MLSVKAPLNISRVLDVVLGFQESIKNNILKRTENFQESLNPATGVDLIKLFWCKFKHSFCKLDLFMEVQQILRVSLKWCSLQK